MVVSHSSSAIRSVTLPIPLFFPSCKQSLVHFSTPCLFTTLIDRMAEENEMLSERNLSNATLYSLSFSLSLFVILG